MQHRADETKEVENMANSMEIAYMKPAAKCNMDDLNYQNKVERRVEGPWLLKKPPMKEVTDVTYVEEQAHKLPYLREVYVYLMGGCLSSQDYVDI